MQHTKKVSTLIPEGLRMKLRQAVMIMDEKARIKAIDEVTKAVRVAHPELYIQGGQS